MNLMWIDKSWDEYLSWEHDKRTLRKIHTLLKEIQRTPFEGTGMPEELRHELSGWWSRRIDERNRMVYKVENDTVVIMRCKGHY